MQCCVFRIVVVTAITAAIPAAAQESGSGHLQWAREYADAMMEGARDHYGREHSPLFAAALDRRNMTLLEGEALARATDVSRDDWGIRESDRSLFGANPMHGENLYQILYALTDVTGEAKYENAADNALNYFFNHCQSEATGFFAWGEHIGWDFRTESRIDNRAGNIHEYFRPWVLWEKTFEIAPGPAAKFAKGVWEHQIGDRETGNFSRHAQWDGHGPGKNSEYPRHGGSYIATWAYAYGQTGDDVFLHAIDTLLRYFDGRRHPESDAVPAESASRSNGTTIWPPSNLSLAIDLHSGAELVPKDLADRMRSSAQRCDAVFLKLPHELGKEGRGIVTFGDIATLAREQVSYADLWATGYGDYTEAQLANMCLLRYDQTANRGYKELAMAAAERYLDSEPPGSGHIYPGAMGDAIWLLTGAYEITNDGKYLNRAKELAAKSHELFLDDGSPIPRASSKLAHYEAITRADTLMMALLRLWTAEHDPDAAHRLVYCDR